MSGTRPTGTVATVLVRAGAKIAETIRAGTSHSPHGPKGGTPPRSGWLAVTVACEPSDIDTSQLPGSLAKFARDIEVRVHPAPAGKGIELAVRPLQRPEPGNAVSRLSGSDPLADLRAALRQAKQLLEVGEVLAVDPAPHGERSSTPGGALLETWTRKAPKGGVR